MSDIKLKPCPFCGDRAAIHKKNDDEVGFCYFVFCTKCCCETQYSRTEEEAISDWNRRADNEKRNNKNHNCM